MKRHICNPMVFLFEWKKMSPKKCVLCLCILFEQSILPPSVVSFSSSPLNFIVEKQPFAKPKNWKNLIRIILSQKTHKNRRLRTKKNNRSYVYNQNNNIFFFEIKIFSAIKTFTLLQLNKKKRDKSGVLCNVNGLYMCAYKTK